MMYPRLKLARNLLTDDGVIFISIDDNEQEHLKRIAVEIFGESNFIGQFVWKKGGTGKNDSSFAVTEHEYVLAFARNSIFAHFDLDPDGTVTTSYNQEDEHGKYSLVRLDMQNLQYSSSLDYELEGPDGTIYKLTHKNPSKPNAIWRWSKERVRDEIGSLVFKDGKVYTKNYAKSGAKSRSLLVEERFGVTRTGGADAEKAMGVAGVFDFPKPVRLIQYFLNLVTSGNDLVLDFFAGSGTTGQAVIDLNGRDGGKRNYILVQLPEPTGEDSLARELGFSNIADISRERIRRAGAAIVAEREGQLDSGEKPLDVGFRSYKLNASNFAKWQVTSDVEAGKLGEHLLSLRSSADDDATPDDLLTEVLLKQGYSLTEQISKIDIAGLEIHSVGDGLVLAYLNEHVKPALEQFRAVVDAGPSRLIVLEDAYQGDDQLKTNLEQLCKSKSIELWRA